MRKGLVDRESEDSVEESSGKVKTSPLIAGARLRRGYGVADPPARGYGVTGGQERDATRRGSSRGKLWLMGKAKIV